NSQVLGDVRGRYKLTEVLEAVRGLKDGALIAQRGEVCRQLRLECGVVRELQPKRRRRKVDGTVRRCRRRRVWSVRLRTVVVRTGGLGTRIGWFVRMNRRRRRTVVARVSTLSRKHRHQRQTYERRDGDWQPQVSHAYPQALRHSKGDAENV